MQTPRRIWIYSGLIFLLWIPAVAFAQISTASINGTVSDPQGAIIPSAELLLTNTRTGVQLRTRSTEAGLYRFQNVQVGTYTLAASSQGFATKRLDAFTLTVNQAATLDFVLDVGAITETVNVQAAAVQLQSSSAELGQAIEEKQVKDLPLNGRNFTQMMMLQPGVVMVPPPGTQSMSYTRQIGEGANPSVNGQNNRANVYMLDGVSNFETFGNAYAVPPIIDAIQEFKVQSHNDSAEMGMGSGGTVNVVTKSGTNNLNGTVWYFGKNDAFNARQFNQAIVNPFKQHQYGATAGGPVVIPKLYNGKNKTFVFGAFQGFRFGSPARTYYNVPSEAMLNGDFREVGRNIFNPRTTRVDAASGAFIRDPFANNMIPASLIDKRMVDYIVLTGVPKPIVTDRPQFNALDIRNRTLDQEEFQIRVDHNFSSTDMVWFRYSGLDQRDKGAVSRANLSRSREMEAANLAASWVHIFGPTSTMQIQFGKSTSDIPDINSFDSLPSDIVQRIGLGPELVKYRSGTILSGFALSNYFGGTPSIVTNRPADNWQFRANYSRIKGTHTLKFGGEFIRADMFRTQGSHGVNFREFETADPRNSARTGDSVASMLLNAPFDSSRRDIVESLRFGGNLGFYVQDSWKATQRLTINFGLRYDYTWIPGYGTVADRNIFTGNANTDTGQYLVLKVPDSCAKTGGAPCIPTPDGSLPANVIAAPNEKIMNGRTNMFQPRIGIAYRLTDRTTIRTAGGVIFDSWAGVYQSSRGIGGTWPDVSVTRLGNLNDPRPGTPFPGVVAQDPSLGASLIPAANPFNQEWWFMDPEWKQGYSMQWNFGVQHQLTQATVAEVNYVGSGNRDLDLGGRRNTAVTPGPGDPRNRMRFPYMRPTFFAKSIGRSNYNSMQASLKRSFSDRLAVTVAYTWAKSIDVACSGFFGTEGCGVQNEYDLNNDRSVSAFDIPHNFVASWVYELPIGKGSALSTRNRVLDAVIGNWQFNGLVNFRNGIPYNVTVPGDLANVFNSGTYLRPNLVGNPNLTNPTPERWLNTDAFAAPAPFTFGNSGRNILRPDNVYRFDLSLFRRFPLKERVQMELRVEAFNAFNSNFYNRPDSNLASPRFGLVTGLQAPPRELQLGAKILF